MANSNENTQNPKENQEKTAEKGSQEHSEHTAENKQPESKDNVEKKDESTCLCKFFTKIAEWICARKNKNSNKADENAAKNDDAAKQEEMKQAETVEQTKEQRKLSDYLEIISKLLGISAIFGTFIGGFFIYYYLKYLGQLSIFPEVITNPSALIASALFFGVIVIIFMIKSLCIFSTGYTFTSKNELKLMSLVFLIPYIITFYFLFDFILKFIEDETVLRLIIIIIFVGFDFAYLYFGIGYKKLYQDKQLKKDNFATLITVTLIISIIILMLPNFKYRYFFKSTHFIRLAESPKDSSSWYLLHNNFQKNNGSQETNGIDKNDLLKLKQKFKCSALSETERKEEDISCSTVPEKRNNALYGFMAWNLGDTKVFCPISSIKSSREELKKECIVISGKALQIMPEDYISTDIDNNNGGNPDNTGHDDPAIDINTDVRFKNDLNSQSNAGLNNYNIQPVLPIQSNAKNMSIQIHYGSCNHDSPRNKDSHPDIGYTDKKICQ
mgnify:CR=1 FL=1